MDEAEIKAIARAVVAHLKANPLASDTQEGIARWWMEPTTDVSDEALGKALQLLMRVGAIEELLAADGRKRYRRHASARQLGALLSGALGSPWDTH